MNMTYLGLFTATGQGLVISGTKTLSASYLLTVVLWLCVT